MPLQAGVKRKYKNNDEKYYTKSVNDSAKKASKKLPKKSTVTKPSQQKAPSNAYTDTATKAAQTIKKNVEGKKASQPKYKTNGIAKANTGNTAKPQTAKQKWVSDRNAYKRTDSDKVTYKVGDSGAKGSRGTVGVAEYPPNKKKVFGERKPTATGYSKASKGIISTGVGGQKQLETSRYNSRKVDAGSRDMQYKALSGMLNADEPTRRITDVHGRTAVDDRFRVNNLDDWFNVGGKLMSNTYDSLADNSLVGAAYSYGTGNKLSSDFNADNPYNEQRTQGATAMAGRMIGLAGNYMMGRAALAPQLERASEAVMNGTKVGKMLQGSSKLGKIGQNIGLTGRELGKELVTETIADSTIGLAQNALLNYGEGLRGGDLLKQTAKDLALDIGVGGVMEGVGLYGKVVRKPNEILSQNIKEGLTPATTKKEYIQGLLNRAHDNIELRSGSDVSQKLSDAIMTKNTEILDEIHKVEAMDGQQFNRYKIGRDINGDYYDVRRGREGVTSVKRNEAETPEASKAETPAAEPKAEAKTEEAPKAVSPLEKEADEKSFEDFMKTPSKEAVADAKAKGIKGGDFREFWRDRKMQSFTRSDAKELSKEEAYKIMDERMDDNIMRGWYKNYDSTYKSKIEDMILTDKEVRNAGLNLAYHNFKDFDFTGANKSVSFEEFLDTPITLYRGTKGQNLMDEDVFVSFTPDIRVARRIGGNNAKITEITVTPRETFGSYDVNGEQEYFIPRKVYEAQTPKEVDVSTAKTKSIEVPSEKEEQILTDYQELSMSNEASVENVVKYSDGEYTTEEVESVLRKNGLLEEDDLKESANGRKNTQLVQEGNLQQGTAKGNSGSESVLQGERPRRAGDLRGEAEGRGRASGDLQVPEGDLVDESTDKILKTDKSIPKRTAKKVDDIEEFSKRLDENRATNEYGCCVSPVDPADYDKETRYFTTHEGQVTGGVEKNGNIAALSKSSNAAKGVNSHEALMTAFGMGGNRADAYGIGLADRYQRYGLVPVARVPFDENVVRKYFRPNEVESSLATFRKMKDTGNDPDVYFFAKFDDLENTIKTRNNGGYRILSEEELKKLPEMDYKSAEEFRNSLLDDADKKAAYMKEHGISDVFTESKVAEAKPARKPIKRLGKKAETVATEAKAEAKAEVKPAKTAEADLPKGGKLEKVGEFEVVGGGKGVETTTPTETNLPFIERFKRTVRNARRDLINSEAGIERMDKVAGQTKIQEKSYMARNAKGQTGHILDKGLVNRKGEKIGESLSKVLGGDFEFNGKKYKSPYRDAKTGKLFDEYAMELHNTYRAKQGKSIYGGRDYAEEVDQIIKNYPALADEKDRLLKWLNDTDGTTSKEQRKALEERLRNKYENFDDVVKDLNNYRAAKSQARVDEILKEHPEFKQVTKNMDEWWNKFTDEYLAGSGILSADDVKKFKELYPHYVPTFRDMGEAAGRETKNAANLIKRATGSGKRTLLTVPEQYAHQIDRIVNAARKNELYQEIINTLSKDPAGMKAFGAVLDNKGKMVYDFSSGDIDEFITSLDEISLSQIKGGKNTITAVFGGQTVKANVSDEVAKSLEAMNNLMNTNLITKIGKTITNPMKFTITGGNPVFFVSNMMRDLPTLYIQSNHGMLRTTIGLAKATKEVFTNGEKYQMYKALGGAESGYYMRGKGFETSMSSKGAVKRLQEVVTFLGEKGEAIPRMAEFINTLEKTGDPYRALRDAAESTVDFSRKGSSDVAQALDAWTLYLNAGVQGLDKFARTVAEHPLRTAGRSATMLGVPFLALTALNYDNPHYQDLTERVKQNNFLIPNLQGEKDENGYWTTFIKVPLNREYGTVFAASLYCALKGANGEDDSWEGFSETFKENFLPNNPLTDNVLAPLLINIPQNKDFAGRSIIPSALKDASPENQYDYDTSEFAKLVASGMNKIPVKDVPILKYLQSPKLVDYILDSYSGYYGQALKSATTTGGTSMDNYVKDVLLKQTAEQPFINKFRADARYSSKPVSDLYDLKDEYAKKKTDAEMSGKTWSEAHAAEAALSKISKGIYESTQAEKAILEDKSLTKAEKDKLIGELRTARNELAKQAPKEVEAAIKEYKEAPAFSALNEKTKEKWNKDLKIGKQDWALAYGDIVDSYDERKDATGSGTTAEEKRYILMQHGITSYKVAQSILGDNTSKAKWDEAVKDYKTLRPQYSSDEAFRKAIAQQSIEQKAKEKEIEEITKNMSKSEASFYKYYQTRADDRYNKSKNVSKTIPKDLYDDFIYESQYVDKHTNNNGSITQPEARNIIENLDKMYGLSQTQKACLWYLAENDGGWKKKPYGNYKP